MISSEPTRPTHPTQRIARPPRWPLTLGLICGAIFLITGIWSGIHYADVAPQLDAIEEQMALAPAVTIAEVRALRVLESTRADLITLGARWRKRRVGFLLAGVVLLVGGFFANGMLQLHDKMEWAMIDDDNENENDDD